MPEPSPLTPNAFRGSAVDRNNQAIRVATGSGLRVVIPRCNLAQNGERNV